MLCCRSLICIVMIVVIVLVVFMRHDYLLMKGDGKFALLLACDDEDSLFACNVMYLIE